MPMQMETITWFCEDCGHRVKQTMKQIAPAKCPKCHGVRKMSMGKYKGVWTLRLLIADIWSG